MLHRQIFAGARARFMHRTTVHDGIGPRKVNVLENAHFMRFFTAVFFNTANSVFIEYDYFARFDIPYKFRSDRVERATFRRHYVISVGGLAVTQRAKSVFVPYRNKFRGRHYN